MISQLYLKVKLKKELSSSVEGDADYGNSTLTQLREIEHTLLVMFEARDNLDQKGQNNPDLLRRFLEAEKHTEKTRKQARYEKKRRQEMETTLARQQKIEKRTQRSNEVSQSMNLTLRHVMQRSDKPRKEKKVIQKKQLTVEELDFMRYVDPDARDLDQLGRQ